MILTTCAACAAPLPRLAKQCSRCKTRYCGAACQAQHWKEGGHDKRCKKIRKGGGAEQSHADKKYKEVVAVAVEACTEDTNGQKCYLCLEAVHSRTGEGLVRGCACGDRDGVSSPELGVVHVSCLARQAKIAYEGDVGMPSTWNDWYICRLCEQQYHGVVACALGWACWKTYVDRPENDETRKCAMYQLGNGLMNNKQYADAVSIYETCAAPNDKTASGNLASCYSNLGRHKDALRVKRKSYYQILEQYDDQHPIILTEAYGFALILTQLERWSEAKNILGEHRRRQWRDAIESLQVEYYYAYCLVYDDAATLKDLSEAKMIMEEVPPAAERLLGTTHPKTKSIIEVLRLTSEKHDAVRAKLEKIAQLETSR